jgi:hypothetical protein
MTRSKKRDDRMPLWLALGIVFIGVIAVKALILELVKIWSI